MPYILNDWTLEFAQETGGSLKACIYQGHDILRPAVATSDARETSAFPMVPFIGRITNGNFAFNGHSYSLVRNMPPEPHAIHGLGWQSSWVVETIAKDNVRLLHSYAGKADWPWAYSAAQSFFATQNALTLTMSLTNKSTTTMPAGLGWHPYFPRAGAQIQADVTEVWAGMAGNIIGDHPQALTHDTDLRIPRPADDLTLDHCFTAGGNGIMLAWPARGLSLKMTASSALRHLTVYTPAGEDYFCVEPVSHAPDAVNSALPTEVTGLSVLQPGETLEATITLTVGKL